MPLAAFGENKSGVEPQVLSLPKGPGSIEGLGESFEPQLNTGTAAYRVKLAVPPGTAGFQPALALVYNSGYGNGPLGLGWQLDAPSIQRQTDKGLPEYSDADTLIHSQAGELVPLGDGVLRSKIEGSFIKVQRSGAGFEVFERNGVRHWFGASPQSRLDNARGTFEWRVERSEDTNGNAVLYRYEQDQGQIYLTEVRYGLASDTVYKSIHFNYGPRPDPVTDYRSRARVATALRLTGIEMRSIGTRVRAYRLEYGDDTSSPSLMRQVIQLGADGVSALPPMSFDYSIFDRTLVQIGPMANPPPGFVSLANPNVDLIDIDGDGLPDLVYTPTGPYPHRFYLNQGRGAWAEEPVEPQLSPRRTLETNGVMMSDMNGDGLADLFVKGTRDFGYFKNRGALAWEDADWVSGGPVPRFDFEDARTRLVDLDNDKLIDVLRDRGSSYLVWLNPGEGAWSQSFDAETRLPDSAHLPLDRSRVKLGDMNGDRIQDLVYLLDGRCSYFPGMGFGAFDAEVIMDTPPFDLDPARLGLTDFDHDGLGDWVEVGNRFIRVWRNAGDGGFEPEWRIEHTPSTSGQSDSRFADMDGDGSLDLLVTNPDAQDPYQWVSFNGGAHPHLLTAIRNGLGQETRIDYRSSVQDYLRDRDAGIPWSRKLPFPMQVVGRVTVLDGNSGEEYVTDYRFRDGYYDGTEKEFRGFAQVERHERGGPGAPGLVTRFSFDVGDLEESRKGMTLTEAVLTETGTQEPPVGLFQVADHVIETRTLASGGDAVPVRYSFTRRTDTRIYESGDEPIKLRHQWDQDLYGNTIQDLDYGIVSGDDPAPGDDDLLTAADYRIDLDRWIIDRPIRVAKTRLDGRFVSLQRLTYDTQGNLTRDERSPDGIRFIPITRNDYDNFGNTVRITDANGHWRGLDYDPTFHAFPVLETIGELDLEMAADYDLGLGLMTGFTDPNGQRTGFGYDTFGRLVRILKPGDSDALPTQAFEYRLGDPVSAILTRSREVSGEPGTHDAIAWFDGLGRKLQTRSEGENGDWVVKEAAIFNARRGIARQWLPHFAASPDYADPDPSFPHTSIEYDARARSIRETNPDGTVRTTEYRPLAKIEWDEEDNDPGGPHADTPHTSITDARERLIEVRERNGAETYTTRYAYDGLDNLIRIEDDQGNIKTLQFDGLGRKTQMDDPDKGEMTYVYDAVGNLVSTTDAKGQTLSYSYDAANRTLSEDSTEGGGVRVRYHYDADRPEDAPSLTNTLGRLVWLEDQAGRELYAYDARGNIATQVRRLDGLDFITRMEHDAMERLTRLTYPDGSAVGYGYNAMGQLDAVPGYVQAIDYVPTGQKSALRYANGVASRYEYDTRQRLRRLHTESPVGAILQDLVYTYDRASNIARIADQRPAKTPEDRTGDYGYDDLYRLTTAASPDWSRTYAYNSIGNMTFKSDLGAMTYGAGSAGPHALTQAAGIDYGYDANGNLATKAEFLYHFDHRDRLARVERAATNARAAALIDYAYDSGFDRKKKTVNQAGETQTTLYVDRYTELRADRLIKQVFAGDRLVARVSVAPFSPEMLVGWAPPTSLEDIDIAPADGTVSLTEVRALGADPAIIEPADAAAALRLYTESRETDPELVPFATVAAAMQTLGDLPEPPTRQTVFYIPDHLGSASIVADADGAVVEESVFYPYGQDRARAGGYESEYRFTGKELDGETGLHYFRARYFDSKSATFIAADPLCTEGLGGNLSACRNAYSYGAANPLANVDADGLLPWPVLFLAARTAPIVVNLLSNPQRADQIARFVVVNPLVSQHSLVGANAHHQTNKPAAVVGETPSGSTYVYQDYAAGDHGGQCVAYAKKITTYSGALGTTLKEKLANAVEEFSSNDIAVGNIIVLDEGSATNELGERYGHVAVVTGREGDTLTISESNYCNKNCENVSSRTIDSNSNKIRALHATELKEKERK